MPGSQSHAGPASQCSVLILGAGQIGQAIALKLLDAGGYDLLVADHNLSSLQRLQAVTGLPIAHVQDAAAMESVISGRYAVINALPFHQAVAVATLCARHGVHYFDLTEDVASTHAIHALARDARSVLMPQCGLAPGFIGIVGNELAGRLEVAQALRLRVGALPRFPQGSLRYSLTWSTEGLINEYCRPCEVIAQGQLTTVPALDGLEPVFIDGVEYEAFHTSGGLGMLPQTWQGRIEQLDYKTIRYPGHRAAMRLLLTELRLGERRDLLRELLEGAIASTQQDVIVILASATGQRAGRLVQESYCARITGTRLRGQTLSAIQHTTAASICTALDLVRSGRLAQRGFVQQESVVLADFLGNRFGRVYDVEGAQASG